MLVGLGSFLFHISGTFVGEFADLSAMFLLGSLMVTMEARRRARVSEQHVWKMRKAKVDHRFAFWLGATFAVALGVWTLDLTGVVCRPSNHVFTGHSAWHRHS